MITPLNTEYNRLTSILAPYGHAEIEFVKTGVVYFKWQPVKGEPVRIKCEEGLFKRNFRYTEALKETNLFISIDQKKEYIDYPFGLTKKKPA